MGIYGRVEFFLKVITKYLLLLTPHIDIFV